jgi:hypothetical protein
MNGSRVPVQLYYSSLLLENCSHNIETWMCFHDDAPTAKLYSLLKIL